MARIKVQPVKDVVPRVNSDDIFGMACLASLYYPTEGPDFYLNLPLKRLKNMLKIAERKEALQYSNLLQIRAVGLDKGSTKAVETLNKHYEGIINA